MPRVHPLLALSCLLPAGCAGELVGEESSYLVVQTRDAAAPACGDITGLFEQHCGTASCHGGPSAGAGLDLTSPGLDARLVGVASFCDGRLLVDPEKPADSYLLEKLESSAPQCGSMMPYGSRLDADTLRCVQDWVTSRSAAADASPGALP